MDCFRNIALFPASLAFDRFVSRLNEVGKLELGSDRRFRFPTARMSDYSKLYVSCVRGIAKELSATAKKIVFVEECLPQHCSFHRKFPDGFEPSDSNTVRWILSEDIDVPIDAINHMILTTTQKALKSCRKVVYIASRTLCEQYVLDGVRFVLGQRIVNNDIRYQSLQWKRVNDVPVKYVERNLPDEPFLLRNETLNYLWSKIGC